MARHPMQAFVTFHRQLLAGRVRFPRARIGETLRFPEGDYTVFRQMTVAPGPGDPATPEAVFQARFHPAGMTPRINRLMSWLPVPLIGGFSGFRSKLWLMNPTTGDIRGLYEWNTLTDAQAYTDSTALRLMTKRAAPGSTWLDAAPRDAVDIPGWDKVTH